MEFDKYTIMVMVAVMVFVYLYMTTKRQKFTQVSVEDSQINAINNLLNQVKNDPTTKFKNFLM